MIREEEAAEGKYSQGGGGAVCGGRPSGQAARFHVPLPDMLAAPTPWRPWRSHVSRT